MSECECVCVYYLCLSRKRKHSNILVIFVLLTSFAINDLCLYARTVLFGSVQLFHGHFRHSVYVEIRSEIFRKAHILTFD